MGWGYSNLVMLKSYCRSDASFGPAYLVYVNGVDTGGIHQSTDSPVQIGETMGIQNVGILISFN